MKSLALLLALSVLYFDKNTVVVSGADPDPSIISRSSVDDRDADGYNAIYYAVRADNTSVAASLVQQGADLHQVYDWDSWTLLHVAAWYGSPRAAEWLVTRGLSVGVPTEGGATPLHWAAWNGRLSIAKLLVEHRADVHAKTLAGETPLTLAEDNHQKEVADYLRSAGGTMLEALEA